MSITVNASCSLLCDFEGRERDVHSLAAIGQALIFVLYLLYLLISVRLEVSWEQELMVSVSYSLVVEYGNVLHIPTLNYRLRLW